MSGKVNVSAQGISQDLLQANGSYDEVKFGAKDNFELYDFLNKVQNIRIPEVSSDQDFCYPNVIIDCGGGRTMNLGPGDGKIQDNDTETDIPAKDAVKAAFGELKIDKRAKMKERRDSSGKTPALKNDVPPTDRDRVRKNNIDTGPSSPQFSLIVWKSSGWKEFAYYFPIVTAIFCFLIGLLVAAEGREGEAEMAPMFFLAGIVLFFLIFPLKKWGKHEYKMGVDWKSNTLWFWRSGKGVVDFEPDANMIEFFGAMDSTTKSFNYRALSDPSQSFYRVKKSWTLMMKRTTSEHPFPVKGSTLATKKEAMKVTQMANQLWESQRKTF